MHRLFRHSLQRQGRLCQATAAFLAALVLVLAVLAVCPALHEWLHPDACHEDHECAVTLFAHGITPVLAEIILAVIAVCFVAAVAPALATLYLAPPRYWLHPERGPPLS
jgi:hypothetical protein